MSDPNIEYLKKDTPTRPLKEGGFSFETKILYKKSNNRIVFRPTTGYSLLCCLFILAPLVLIIIGISKFIEIGNFDFIADNNGKLIVILLVGLILGAIPMIYYFFSPIVFDKSIDRFYNGFHRDKTKFQQNIVPLSQIIAVQIIGEIVQDEFSKYKSFELNLVLKSATRINVIDHSNLGGIIEDAETLSQFLNVPIWHAASNRT